MEDGKRGEGREERRVVGRVMDGMRGCQRGRVRKRTVFLVSLLSLTLIILALSLSDYFQLRDEGGRGRGRGPNIPVVKTSKAKTVEYKR